MIPCICVNNSNIPIDFPLPSQWLEKDKEYHIVDVDYVVHSETIGYKLLEKKNKEFYPYLYFRSDRFVFNKKYLKQIIEMLEKKYDLPEEETTKVKRKLELQEI